MEWEKCTRLLLLNCPADLILISEKACTLISNIIKNPNEERFRTVKCSNKILQQQFFSKYGGLEYLLCAGFVLSNQDESNQKILTLVPRSSAENIKKIMKTNVIPELTDYDIEDLRESMVWLETTVQDCLNLRVSRISKSVELSDNDPCAECLVQIRLPTGSTVTGGFMGNDLLLDIKSFARSFFTELR